MYTLLLLLLLSCFSRVRLCATPQTAAHQAPLSLGFSRQEYWSGLPFPFPMHACMLSCFSHVRLCVALWTAAHQALLSMGFSRQEYWSGLPCPSPIKWTSFWLTFHLLSPCFISINNANYLSIWIVKNKMKDFERKYNMTHWIVQESE